MAKPHLPHRPHLPHPGRPEERSDHAVRQAVWRRDSYVLLFGILIVDYVILSLVNSTRWGGVLRVVPISLTLLWAVYTSNARPAVIRFAQWSVAVAVVGSIVQAATDRPAAAGTAFAFLTVLLIVTPFQIIHRVFEHERVDVQTVFAAIDVYVLIGLIFSAVFLAVDKLSYAAGRHSLTFLAQPGPHPSSNFVYLSFVTLTTVGFGDLTPITDLARSIVVLEALIGQIFLVTMVARIVALVGVGPVRHRVEAEVVPPAREAPTLPGSSWAEPQGPPPPDDWELPGPTPSPSSGAGDGS